MQYAIVSKHISPPHPPTHTRTFKDGANLPEMQTSWLQSHFTDGKLYPSNQSTVDSQWASSSPPANVGSHCANPAKSSLVAWPPYPRELPGTDTTFCYCANVSKARTLGTRSSSSSSSSSSSGTSWGYCRSPPSMPEQINVVLGQANSVRVRTLANTYP